MNAVFLFDKLTRVSVLYGHAQNLRHISPQNRFSLKEFESTTREIGLIIFQSIVSSTEQVRKIVFVFAFLKR